MSDLTYSTGTIDVTNGSATVVGHGTSWATTTLRVNDGDFLQVTGAGTDYAWYPISVNGDTSITLIGNYRGTTGSGLAYRIARTSATDSASQFARQLAATIAKYQSLGIDAATGSITITSAAAMALAVGANGVTNPALQIDASASSVATGLKVTGKAAGSGLALAVISSGTNENLTIDAKGSGTITLGGTSTGAIVHTRATTLSAALTYGGVTLSNAVTGTGNMVLSASPTFTGTLSAASIAASGTLTVGGASLPFGAGLAVTNTVSSTGIYAGYYFEGRSGSGQNWLWYGSSATAYFYDFTASVNLISITPTLAGTTKILQTTASTSTTTGALVVSGGAGIAGSLFVGGAVYINTVTAFPGNGNTTGGAMFESGGSDGTTLFLNRKTNPAFYVARDNDGVLTHFFRNSAAIGNISVTASAVSYNTTSDQRLKTDQRSFDAGPIIDRINAYDFMWRESGARAFGVYAQEVNPVFPHAITKPARSEEMWSVDYSKFVPLLLNEAKALRRRVSELEARAA